MSIEADEQWTTSGPVTLLHVARARRLAAKVHAGQRYGGESYFDGHLTVVAELCAKHPDAVVEAAAWLHDAVEDTDLTIERIDDWVHPDVGALVEMVTDPKGPNRRARKTALYERFHRMRLSDWRREPVAFVKLADRLANVRSCVATENRALLEMYAQEHPTFRRAFCLADEQPKHAALWAELDGLLDFDARRGR